MIFECCRFKIVQHLSGNEIPLCKGSKFIRCQYNERENEYFYSCTRLNKEKNYRKITQLLLNTQKQFHACGEVKIFQDKIIRCAKFKPLSNNSQV